VVDLVADDERFTIQRTTNHYGNEKLEICLNKDIGDLDLDLDEISCIDKVIDETRGLYWKDFIKHVYNTEPIKNSDRYQKLVLPEIASKTRAPT